MQNLLRLVFPPQCIGCGTAVDSDFALCGTCWGDTPFAAGLVCDCCGQPLPGEGGEGGDAAGPAERCDECLALPRPWQRGRAALVYRDRGRSLVLALKHGDRLDLVPPLSRWMARAARPIVAPGMLVAPVPLHWRRLLRRRFNQAALLSAAVARESALDHCPDLLLRPRATPSQEGRDRALREANLDGAITVNPRRRGRIGGRSVLIVDDVMTSGATLAAAARACTGAGAASVSVLVLARVAKDA